METIYLRIDKNGRCGKTVTVLQGFTRQLSELEDLARQIKISCGTGGTIRNGSIEIQGDFREPIARFLRKQGFQVKGF